MNCKDEELNAKLYSNRAAAHFNLGKKLQSVIMNTHKYFLFNDVFGGGVM